MNLRGIVMDIWTLETTEDEIYTHIICKPKKNWIAFDKFSSHGNWNGNLMIGARTDRTHQPDWNESRLNLFFRLKVNYKRGNCEKRNFLFSPLNIFINVCFNDEFLLAMVENIFSFVILPEDEHQKDAALQTEIQKFDFYSHHSDRYMNLWGKYFFSHNLTTAEQVESIDMKT